jgi:Flp pilus assembly protein TadG
MSRKRQNDRTGIAMVYTIVIMIGLCALCSLAVDFGHVQLVKTELRRAADSAARAAASQLRATQSAAIAKAVEYAGYNKADGTLVVLDQVKDIEFGTWSPSDKKFKATTSTDISTCNAVHVTARRITARGTSVPLMFARVLGQNTCDVQAETIVQFIPGVHIDDNIPATGWTNPPVHTNLIVARIQRHNSMRCVFMSCRYEKVPTVCTTASTYGTRTHEPMGGDVLVSDDW